MKSKSDVVIENLDNHLASMSDSERTSYFNSLGLKFSEQDEPSKPITEDLQPQR